MPKTQSALLEAMAERQVTADGVTRLLTEPFLLLATENPVEYEGTFPLPEAQLDRFLVRVRLGYPAEDGEREIARRYREAAEPLEAVTRVAGTEALRALQDAARTVHVGDDVERYAVALVRGTRQHPDLRLGASPRASVGLYRTAQAWAILDGRDFVLPDDVRSVTHSVLDHRLLLDVDRELRGATVLDAVDEVLAEVPVPLAEEPATPTG
jgi:MoxR-like ATPase